MRLMQIVRKPRELWSRFAAWRTFHSRYGLAQVVAYISIGSWQRGWNWQSGTFMLLDSSTQPKFSVCTLTPRVQLTLVRFYVSRVLTITELDDLSKQVCKQDHSTSKFLNI